MQKHPSVLVLAAGSLGDCLLTLPALQELQTRSLVTVAGTTPYLQLGSELLGVEKVLALEPLLQTLSGGALDPSFWSSFQEVFVFFKTPDAPLTAALAPFTNLKIVQPSEAFDAFLQKERWVGEYWLSVVNPRAETAPLLPKPAHLKISEAVKNRGAELCLSLNLKQPFVVHPGSGSRSKNASLSFFRKAAEKAAAEAGKEILITWGEAESDYLDEIKETFKGLSKTQILEKPLALKDLAAVLTQACGYLGNDSGVTHLASACGVKTFAVFNATDSRIWGPQEAIILEAMKTFYS